MKSGTITLAQLKGKFKEAEKPAPVKQDNQLIAKEAFLKRKAQIKELKKLLYSTYPEIFDYDNPKPLAIGIDKKIRTALPQFSHRTVKFLIAKWVRNPKYLKSLISSEQRVDLNNQTSSLITEDQKRVAQDFLDRKKVVKDGIQNEPV